MIGKISQEKKKGLVTRASSSDSDLLGEHCFLKSNNRRAKSSRQAQNKSQRLFLFCKNGRKTSIDMYINTAELSS